MSLNQEFMDIVKELRELTEEVDSIQKQMTESLIERVKLLEKLVLLMVKKQNQREIIIDKAFYRVRLKGEGLLDYTGG